MFKDFHEGELNIYRINFALLTLIPKENNARHMSKFRPLSLLNCSYMIFTKVLNNRLAKIIDRLIGSNQTAFIKGGYILDSVVTAHEVIHSVYNSDKKGCVLKIDYEKACDKVSWDFFLLEVLRKKGLWSKMDNLDRANFKRRFCGNLH